MEIEIIGQMDNTADHTFESANRVYDRGGISPTLPTSAGGGITPKVLEISYLDKGTGKHQSNGVYSQDGISPAVTAMFGVKQPPTMTLDIKCLGGVGEKKSNGGTQYYQQDRVYEMADVAMCHPSNIPGGSYRYLEVKQMEQSIVASRGRDPENPSNREGGAHLEQRLELNSEDICNTLSTVQKDNMVLEVSAPSDLDRWTWEINGETYLIRIRKLTPRECWRLMDFTDADFEKAQAVNSNTQLYKQAGNSIVKNVLCEIFRQLL